MSNGSEFSHSELRRLVDEFGELAGQWRRQRASYVGQLQQAIAHFGVGPQSETVERYERARRQAWLLLPPDARAGCTSFREFVEGQTGEPLSGSLPTSAESCADAILRYLCESATDQDPEVAAGDDAPNDAPASRWMPFVEMQNAFGFRTRKAFGVWVEANKIPCRPRPKKDGTPSKRRRDVDVLAILRAFRSDIAIAKDPVRQARVQRWLSKLEVDKDLEQAASEFLNAK